MDVSGIVVSVLCVGLASLRVSEARRAFRDRTWVPSSLGGFLLAPLGRRVSRGAGRGIAAQAVVLASVAVLLSCVTAATFVPGSLAAALQVVGATVGVAGVLLGGLAGVLIVLLNRPSFMVPPQMRGERGTVADRRTRQR